MQIFFNIRINNKACTNRLFTIKVHALRASARIIGAAGLAKMAADMENYANDLENNGLDAVLEEMKERYLIAFNPRVVKQDLHWNAKACRANIEQKLPDLIGYYRGVAFHIREMMKNNPDRPLISIMGP